MGTHLGMKNHITHISTVCSDIVHKMLRQKEGKIQTNESNLKGWWSFGCTLFTSDVLVQANICMYCIKVGYKNSF